MEKDYFSSTYIVYLIVLLMSRVLIKELKKVLCDKSGFGGGGGIRIRVLQYPNKSIYMISLLSSLGLHSPISGILQDIAFSMLLVRH